MDVLVIDTSPRGDLSASREVSRYLVKKLHGAKVFSRDLAAHPLPHISGDVIEAMFTPADKRTSAHQQAITLSDIIIDEVIDAEAIVISTPMWNFGIPSVLKAWLDHLSRAGRTFSFVDGKPKGLLDSNKQVYFIISSGSRFSSGPFAAWDFAVPALKAALGFLGLSNVQVIRVEGTNDPVSRDSAIKIAKQEIDQIFSREVLTA